MVLASERVADGAGSGRPLAWIHGMAMRSEPTMFAGRDQVNPRASRDCAEDVYRQAGITEPRREIDAAEVYVPFSWVEPMWLESLGFCPEGDGWKLTDAGATALDGGDIPWNCSGGVLSSNPIGASGVLRPSRSPCRCGARPASTRSTTCGGPWDMPMGAARSSSPCGCSAPTSPEQPGGHEAHHYTSDRVETEVAPMKIVVDYDVCASNAVCMGIAPEVFEVARRRLSLRPGREPRLRAPRQGAHGRQQLPHGGHHARRGRVAPVADGTGGAAAATAPGVGRGSVSLPRPPGSSTSAAPGRPCSTGSSPATPGAPSSCASKTPTPSATARNGSRASCPRCRGWAWSPTKGPSVSRRALTPISGPLTACGTPVPSTPAHAPGTRSTPAPRPAPPRATTASVATGGWGAPGTPLRFRVPDDGVTVVHDLIRGDVTFAHDSIEDFVVVKSSGAPLFILANVVDDIAMAITHVIRGEDLLPSTPKGLLLWSALEGDDAALPGFAHLPLLVNERRQKLSKRRDDVAVESYQERGYLAEAMRNYLALLGWSPPTAARSWAWRRWWSPSSCPT